jgi:hypothetical protein
VRSIASFGMTAHKLTAPFVLFEDPVCKLLLKDTANESANYGTQNLDVSEFVRLAVLPKVYHLS